MVTPAARLQAGADPALMGSAAMRRRRLFEMLRDGTRTCWPQYGLPARFAAGRLAPG
jgi:hypothetical protein